ncbi:Glycerophosphocholine phosphodiesterase [Entophlyctis luteolus]|nr:Glycerophosphocholine phosphodiesterase [Entophlyctis luteolus]
MTSVLVHVNSASVNNGASINVDRTRCSILCGSAALPVVVGGDDALFGLRSDDPSLKVEFLSSADASVAAFASVPSMAQLHPISLCGEPAPSGGYVNLPLLATSTHEEIGSVSLRIIISTPFEHPLAHTPLPSSDLFALGTSVVGHRGVGMNKVVFGEGKQEGIPQIRENTLASLAAAHALGCPCVEFDVQLTKDNVTVLYHDSVVSEIASSPEIAQLTAEEFRAVNPEFPTFADVLANAPPDLAFNVELKYPTPYDSRTFHVSHTPEMNKYVDAVLLSILDSPVRDRQIVLSSFNPDICRIAKLKQSRFRVLFLTAAIRDKETMDERYGLFPDAVEFASKAGLDGVVSDGAPLVADPTLVRKAREIMPGGLLFTYGSANIVPGNASVLKLHGVNSLIVDKISQVIHELNH